MTVCVTYEPGDVDRLVAEALTLGTADTLVAAGGGAPGRYHACMCWHVPAVWGRWQGAEALMRGAAGMLVAVGGKVRQGAAMHKCAGTCQEHVVNRARTDSVDDSTCDLPRAKPEAQLFV